MTKCLSKVATLNRLLQNSHGKVSKSSIVNISYKQLKQNQLIKINKKDIQNKDLNYINNQHKNEIDSLKLKLQQLQIENKQHKQELKELKKKNSKDNSNNLMVVEKLKSELLVEKQSLKLLVENICNDLPHCDVENMNSLEDLEKITYIIKKIKTMYADKILEETKVNKTLLDTLPMLTNGLNIVKKELKTVKTVMGIEINNYMDELTAIKKKLSCIFHLKLPHENDNENVQKMFSKLILEQQDGINISNEQIKMLLILNSNLKTLYHEKIELEIKIAKANTELVVSFQANQTLENDLKLAKYEVQKLKDEQVANKIAQDTNIKMYDDKFEKLLHSLIEKEGQLQRCETEKQKLIISHQTEVSNLMKQLSSEKQKLKEQKKRDQKQIEEMCKMLPQYFNKLLNNDDTED